jgi:hypothetical protein
MKHASPHTPPPRRMGRRRFAAGALCAAALMLAGVACDDGSPHVGDPPEGMGRLVIDNRTSEDLRVYFNGEPGEKVGDWSHRTYDFPPGEVRVTLDQRNSDRTTRFRVDILRGRVIIAEVQNDYANWDRLDVFLDID